MEIDPSVHDLILDTTSTQAVRDAHLESKAGDWSDVDVGVDVLRGMDAGVAPQGKVTYAMVDDRTLVVPMERIHAVLQILVELLDEPHLSARRKLSLNRLSALELARALPEVYAEDGAAVTLQRLAVRLARFEGILADDMGFGKSIQAIAQLLRE